MIFFPSRSYFYSLKFSHFFYSFFIRIKVKHPQFKKLKLRELLKFSLLSPHFNLIFSYLNFFSISLHHFQTQVQKINLVHVLELWSLLSTLDSLNWLSKEIVCRWWMQSSPAMQTCLSWAMSLKISRCSSLD